MAIKTKWLITLTLPIVFLTTTVSLLPAANPKDPSSIAEELSRKELAEEHYKRGLAHYRQKDYFQAKVEFDKVLILDPKHKKAGRYSKLTSSKIEKSIEKRGFYQKPAEGADRKTGVAEYLYEVGKSYYFTGQYKEAVQKFKQALLINPSHKGVQGYLRQIEKGLSLEAIVNKEIAVRKEAKLSVARKAGPGLSPGELKKKRAKQAGIDIKRQAKQEFKKGKSCYSSGKYQDAVIHFQKALELKPDYSSASKDLKKSRVRLEKEKVKKAKEQAKKKAEEVKRKIKEAELKAEQEAKEAKIRAKQDAKEARKKAKEAKKKAKEAKKKVKEAGVEVKQRAEQVKNGIEVKEKEAEIKGRAEEVKKPVKEAGIESKEEITEAKTTEKAGKLELKKEKKEEKEQIEKLAKEIARAKKLKENAEEKFSAERAKGYYLEGKDCYRAHQFAEAVKLFQKALELKEDYRKASKYLEKAMKKLEREKVKNTGKEENSLTKPR
ncbi:MAG: tetratricopeptide repeat protein [Candidatus Omnitrophota bacterium]|nr:tetratricopeptide repeat protein [Candidatus Omnitrophota bacterium]